MKLKELGYYTGYTATGTYLQGTEKAVKAFQKANDIGIDGVAGIKTLNAVYADILNPETPTPSAIFTPSPTQAPTVSPETEPSASPSSTPAPAE
jgi:peptidoglycan hydrolase-like protein with peptidoglycan-binding domain